MTAAGLDAVGRTALGVAWARASESRNPDRLFTDPLAEFIVATGPERPVRGDLDEAQRAAVYRMYLWIVARTVFLDGVVERAAADGLRQFVILGSGLDGRAFRLEFGDGAALFELDRPSVSEVKESLVADSGLSPTVDRRPVACDLAGDWPDALRDRGFRPECPSVWLAEGLFVYLPADLTTRVVEAMSASAADGSRAGVTARSGRAGPESDPFADVRQLWHDGPDPGAVLTANGWDCSSTDPGSVLAAHGRQLPETGEAAASLVSGVRTRRETAT